MVISVCSLETKPRLYGGTFRCYRLCLTNYVNEYVVYILKRVTPWQCKKKIFIYISKQLNNASRRIVPLCMSGC